MSEKTETIESLMSKLITMHLDKGLTEVLSHPEAPQRARDVTIIVMCKLIAIMFVEISHKFSFNIDEDQRFAITAFFSVLDVVTNQFFEITTKKGKSEVLSRLGTQGMINSLKVMVEHNFNKLGKKYGRLDDLPDKESLGEIINIIEKMVVDERINIKGDDYKEFIDVIKECKEMFEKVNE